MRFVANGAQLRDVEPLACPRANDGLVAQWRLMEGSGGVAVDVSGLVPSINLTLEDARFLAKGGRAFFPRGS